MLSEVSDEIGKTAILAHDHDGLNPLHHIAGWGRPAMVTVLLDAGAEVDVRGVGGVYSGQTPLHFAAAFGSALQLSTLLQAGAAVDARDAGGRTALHVAAVYGSSAHISELLRYGADIDAPDQNGWTPLHWAAKFGNPRVIVLAEVLLNAGADGGAKNNAGETPYELAKGSENLRGTTAYRRLRDAQGNSER